MTKVLVTISSQTIANWVRDAWNGVSTETIVNSFYSAILGPKETKDRLNSKLKALIGENIDQNEAELDSITDEINEIEISDIDSDEEPDSDLQEFLFESEIPTNE